MQSTENGAKVDGGEEMSVSTPEVHKKDSVAKENHKFDDLKRCESEFIEHLKMNGQERRDVVTEADLRTAKMQALIAKAEKYASFLLSRHRAHVDARKGDMNGHEARNRRRMSDVDVEDDNIMMR